jgi:hypothetical protein
MFDTDPTQLDAAALLADVEFARAVSEQAEIRILADAAHWADLHAVVDETQVALPGCEQLVFLGGFGTPEVAEFAPAELGAVLAISPHSAARLIGDALDLRHRLPRLWARIQAGEVRPWIGRNTAQTTRTLSVETAAVVDRRITPWAHSLSWGRLEAIIEAVVIEADPEAAALAVQQAEQAQGVWLRPSNDHGIKDIYIRTQAPAAIWFDASCDRIADGLGLLGDASSKDLRRAKAVGILAQPQQALDLFDQTTRLATGDTDTLADDESPGSRSRVDSKPPATLYVHVSQDAFTRDDGTGVARFEGVGPITIDQAKRFLADCQVTIKPVIDLTNQTPVDAYEVPDRLRDAVHLRSPVDVFPYATNASRNRDCDHTDPYRDPDDGGPPGQTALENLGPMVRFHHRIKTHGRWQVVQVFNGVFVWRSPHGRHYLVDHTGTQPAHKAA